MVSVLLGTSVVSPDGKGVGHVGDLVVDLAANLDRAPVTRVVIDRRGRIRSAVPWTGLAPSRDDGRLVLVEPMDALPDLAPAEVLVRRDILDSPVVLADPPGRARVSDVVLETDARGAWVVELDVSNSGVLRRLAGRSRADVVAEPVRLSEVHLVSPGGHAAQLRVPRAMVFRLGPKAMAEVLTRVSVVHARDILRVADRGVLKQAVPLLHPHVRSRVTGAEPPPRRTRRLAGWRVHRPDRRSGSGAEG
jgi:hypothetical protein